MNSPAGPAALREGGARDGGTKHRGGHRERVYGSRRRPVLDAARCGSSHIFMLLMPAPIIISISDSRTRHWIPAHAR